MSTAYESYPHPHLVAPAISLLDLQIASLPAEFEIVVTGNARCMVRDVEVPMRDFNLAFPLLRKAGYEIRHRRDDANRRVVFTFKLKGSTT